MAQGEAHYHRRAGHEAAEADFSCWESHSHPPALTRNSVSMNQGKVGSTHLLVCTHSCNNKSTGEDGTLASSQQAIQASEPAELSDLGFCTCQTNHLNSCCPRQESPLGNVHPFVPVSLPFSVLKLERQESGLDTLPRKMSFKYSTSEMSMSELLYTLTRGNARSGTLNFTFKILGRIHLALLPRPCCKVRQKNRPSLSKLLYFHLRLPSLWVLNAFENMMKATDPLPGKCTELCTQFQRVHGSLEPGMKTSP